MSAPLRAFALISLVFFGLANVASAQTIGVVQSDILILDTERMLAETKLGMRLANEFQEKRDKLIASNRSIEAELQVEEQALTDLRSEKTPEEFRKLADAFDEKVQQIRQKSERRARDLERQRELAPTEFMRIVQPILAKMMHDGGGVVILDSRSVLLSDNIVDITDLAISRIDAEIGDGATEKENSEQAVQE